MAVGVVPGERNSVAARPMAKARAVPAERRARQCFLARESQVPQVETGISKCAAIS